MSEVFTGSLPDGLPLEAKASNNIGHVTFTSPQLELLANDDARVVVTVYDRTNAFTLANCEQVDRRRYPLGIHPITAVARATVLVLDLPGSTLMEFIEDEGGYGVETQRLLQWAARYKGDRGVVLPRRLNIRACGRSATLTYKPLVWLDWPNDHRDLRSRSERSVPF